MSLTFVFLMSLACVGAFLLTASRVVGWKFILKHATAVDVVFTIMLAIVMAGTITGLLVAIVAGLLMAGVLSVIKAMQRGVKRVVHKPAPTEWEPIYGWDKL